MEIVFKCFKCKFPDRKSCLECPTSKWLRYEHDDNGIYVDFKDIDFFKNLIDNYRIKLTYNSYCWYDIYVYNGVDYVRISIRVHMKIFLIGDSIDNDYCEEVLATDDQDEFFKYLDDNGYRQQMLQMKFVD